MDALEACGSEVHSERLIHFVQAGWERGSGRGRGVMDGHGTHLHADGCTCMSARPVVTYLRTQIGRTSLGVSCLSARFA